MCALAETQTKFGLQKNLLTRQLTEKLFKVIDGVVGEEDTRIVVETEDHELAGDVGAKSLIMMEGVVIGIWQLQLRPQETQGGGILSR